MNCKTVGAIAAGVLSGCVWLASPHASEQASPDARVAAFKEALQDGQKRIRQYEWIETTIISLKGEEKGRKVMRCYYGADGKLEKLPVDDGTGSQAQQKPSGRRGGRVRERVVENKKDEMKEYMERAAALVHQYVPPSAERIQSTKDAGNIAVRPGSDGRASLELANYLLAGDKLTVQVDGASHRLLGLAVSSYLDTPQDAVTLDVRMNALPDGAIYAEQTTFNAAAKHITVVIQNAGYRPMQR
jgi:hypothetical protein